MALRPLRIAARLAFHAGLASALFVTAFQPFIALATTGQLDGLSVPVRLGHVVLVVIDGRLLARLGAALALSLLYLVRLPVLRRRVKEIAYAKCFYLATTALTLVALFTPGLALRSPGAAVLVPSFALYFLNFSLFDVKDVEADRRANIRTLAGAFAPATPAIASSWAWGRWP